MPFGSIVLLISILSLVFSSGEVFAKGGRIEVKSVDFNQVRSPMSAEDWFEMRVVLRCLVDKGDVDRFMRKIGVTAQMAFSVDFGDRSGFEFYERRVVVASLSHGDETVVYYYIHPKLVQRDRIGAAPFSWQVILDLNGTPLPSIRGQSSKNLENPQIAQHFSERMAAEGFKNAGVLQPIYETPFYFTARRKWADSPPYIRISNEEPSRG